IERLTDDRELAVGSVSVVLRKCGNPKCHCAHGSGHPQTLFLFRGDDGKRRCKLIRQNDTFRMIEAHENYRSFRDDMKQLRAIDTEEKRILVALADRRAIQYD
ncbi:MAG: hypothetical protein KJ927_15780, partial [Candidatus Eisenbacteria bacterium]|nr:hypothetical protein [Candidatus Eisenbacteria bacterium]